MSANRHKPHPAATPAAATIQIDAAVLSTVDPLGVVAPQDHAAANEADAGDDALNEPADGAGIVAAAKRGQRQPDDGEQPGASATSAWVRRPAGFGRARDSPDDGGGPSPAAAARSVPAPWPVW